MFIITINQDCISTIKCKQVIKVPKSKFLDVFGGRVIFVFLIFIYLFIFHRSLFNLIPKLVTIGVSAFAVILYFIPNDKNELVDLEINFYENYLTIYEEKMVMEKNRSALNTIYYCAIDSCRYYKSLGYIEFKGEFTRRYADKNEPITTDMTTLLNINTEPDIDMISVVEKYTGLVVNRLD